MSKVNVKHAFGVEGFGALAEEFERSFDSTAGADGSAKHTGGTESSGGSGNLLESRHQLIKFVIYIFRLP
jgi:hypothetical protein